MPDPKYSDALKLLAEEREALREGQLQRVGDLAGRKQALVDDMHAMRLSAREARTLKERAGENARLLEAALGGVREAHARLTALKAVRAGLDIYDASGGRLTVATSSRGLEHKV